MIQAGIAALLAVNLYFAAVKPCTSAEGVVYQRYASRPILQMWSQPLDPGLGIVYGVLARIATRAAGVSELTIRLPAVFGGLLFWAGLSYFCRRFARGWYAVIAFAIIAANPWTFRAFSVATGTALACGLLMTAARLANSKRAQAILLVALAIGSDARAALAAMAAASLAAPFLKISFWTWIDELVLPCLIPGMFLLLPALLIRQRPVTASVVDKGTSDLVRTLGREAHTNPPVLVGVDPSIEPGAVFYRRRYHLDWIRIQPRTAPSSYYILTGSDFEFVRTLDLQVIQNTGDGILAKREAIP